MAHKPKPSPVGEGGTRRVTDEVSQNETNPCRGFMRHDIVSDRRGRRALHGLCAIPSEHHNFSSCGAGFHRGAISSTGGGYHPSAGGSLADRISLRGRPSPRPGEASKKSTSDRGTNQNLRRTNGERKLPLKAKKKEARCSHFLPWVAILFLGSFWGVWGTFFKKSPTKTASFFLKQARRGSISFCRGGRRGICRREPRRRRRWR